MGQRRGGGLVKNELNLGEDSWVCPKCSDDASKYFCGKCGFKIYAGFEFRLKALFVDSIIFLVFTGVFKIYESPSIGYQIAYVGYVLCFRIFYHVFLVGLWGQTLGKMVARIKIVRLDGSEIHWSNAWLRLLVPIVLSVYVILIDLYLGFKTSMHQSLDLALADLTLWLKLCLGVLPLLVLVYDWSEIFVLLTNQKRRAIHDFIAGTVVIHDPRLTPTPWKS